MIKYVRILIIEIFLIFFTTIFYMKNRGNYFLNKNVSSEYSASTRQKICTDIDKLPNHTIK